MVAAPRRERPPNTGDADALAADLRAPAAPAGSAQEPKLAVPAELDKL